MAGHIAVFPRQNRIIAIRGTEHRVEIFQLDRIVTRSENHAFQTRGGRSDRFHIRQPLVVSIRISMPIGFGRGWIISMAVSSRSRKTTSRRGFHLGEQDHVQPRALRDRQYVLQRPLRGQTIDPDRYTSSGPNPPR
jgi:hypothetical protein